MNMMAANVKNECQKLWLKRQSRIALFFAALVPMLLGWMMDFLQDRIGFAGVGMGAFPSFVLDLFTPFILPLILFLAVTELYAGDRESGMLTLVLIRPISRLEVFASKAVALGIYLASLLLVLGIGSLVGSWMAEQRVYFPSISAMAFTWLPFMSLGFMATWMNQWFRKGNVALTVTIMFYFFMKALPWVIPSVAPYLPVSYLDWWNRGSLAQVSAGFMYLISSGVLFFLLGYALFRSKEY